MRAAREPQWGGPLGVRWMDPDVGIALPAFVPMWPARFASRAAARVMATRLREKYRYLGKFHDWRFRPVRLVITVNQVAA